MLVIYLGVTGATSREVGKGERKGRQPAKGVLMTSHQREDMAGRITAPKDIHILTTEPVTLLCSMAKMH